MRTIILDLQSALYAKAIRRLLAQELDDCRVTVSKTPSETAAQSRLLRPDALLLEVTDFAPWTLDERLALCAQVKRDAPGCKAALIADDAAPHELTEQIKKAKQRGDIDAFLFTSATEEYLVAMIDSL